MLALHGHIAGHDYHAAAAAPPEPRWHPCAQTLTVSHRCSPVVERDLGCLFAGRTRPGAYPHVLVYTIPPGQDMDWAASVCEQTGTRVPDAQKTAWCADGGHLGPAALGFLASLVAREQPVVLMPADVPVGVALTRRDLVDAPKTAACDGSMVGHLVVFATADPRRGRVVALGVVKDRALLNDARVVTLRESHDPLVVPVQLAAVFQTDPTHAALETVPGDPGLAAYLVRCVPGIPDPDAELVHSVLPSPFGLWIPAVAAATAARDEGLLVAIASDDLDVSLVPRRVMVLAHACASSPQASGVIAFTESLGPVLAPGVLGSVRDHATRHPTAKVLATIAKRTAVRDYACPRLCAYSV